MFRISKLMVVVVAISALVVAQEKGEKIRGAEKPVAATKKAPLKPAMKTIKETVAVLIRDKKIDKSKKNWRTSVPKFPTVGFDKNKTYTWELTTNKGKVTIEFMPEVAPNHVANFVYLTELGFFDGLSFHRVIPSFMAQGGCPLGTGTGGPGYKFGGEHSPKVRHSTPGLLSMANAGPGTDGSQFFITFKPTPWLDGRHTIFGKVKTGMDTVRELEKAGTGGSGRPKEDLKIEKALVVTGKKKKE